MNWIVTPARNSLLVETVSSLLFVKLVGPPLCEFKPLRYVKTWLVAGHSLAQESRSREQRKVENDNSMKILWQYL